MTDYCSYYFGKSLNDLTYSDIQTFFKQEKEESITLEFKSGQDVPPLSNDIYLNELSKMYATSFILGTISRYHISTNLVTRSRENRGNLIIDL